VQIRDQLEEYVGGHCFGAQRTIDIPGAPVRLQIDSFGLSQNVLLLGLKGKAVSVGALLVWVILRSF
jgi:hypothetical protein